MDYKILFKGKAIDKDKWVTGIPIQDSKDQWHIIPVTSSIKNVGKTADEKDKLICYGVRVIESTIFEVPYIEAEQAEDQKCL